MPVSSFLIIQTAFVGDVVLATAVAERLKAVCPEAGIDFLVRQGNESLLQGHPFLRKVWVWNKKKNKAAGLLRLIRGIRRQRYSCVINLHRFASSGIITALSGAQDTRGFDKNPVSFFFKKKFPHIISAPGSAQIVHETERNQSLIADLAGPVPALPRLYPAAADYDAVAPFCQGAAYVCIAPASVWATKQWPAAKWAELMQAIPEKILLLGGPGDAALAGEIIRLSPRPAGIQNLCGKLSYLQSAALMQGAVMNYVNDSGPLHFCSAVGAPVTAVFLSTVPEFGFGPLGHNARVAQVSGLYCKPCGLHGHRQCPEGHFRCALDLAIQP